MLKSLASPGPLCSPSTLGGWLWWGPSCLPCPLAPGWIGYHRKSKGGRRKRSGYLFPWFLPWGVTMSCLPARSNNSQQAVPSLQLTGSLASFFFFFISPSFSLGAGVVRVVRATVSSLLVLDYPGFLFISLHPSHIFAKASAWIPSNHTSVPCQDPKIDSSSFSPCNSIRCKAMRTSFSKRSFPLFLLLLLFSHSIISDSLRSHGLQHTRPPCPSSSPEVCPNSILTATQILALRPFQN